MSSFRKDFLSGTFYIGIAKYAGILCQIFITAILARLLTPNDYGVIAIAMVFIALFNTLSDIGIGVAVIQRKDFTNTDLDHLYSLSIYLGLFLSFILFLSSSAISSFYNNNQLLYVCELLCMLVFFTCARTVPMNLLYREKKFKYIAFTNLFVHVLCGVAAIIAALMGCGVYALVLSQILSAFLLFVTYSIKYRRHFYFRVDISPLKRVFSYSAYNFAGTIFIYLTQNIDKLLVGKFIGTKPLGFYEKSYNLVFMPINNITFIITPVLHPLFSEFQNDLKELERKFLRIIEYLSYISFPLAIIFFFTSKELILIFYGDQWYPAIPPFQIMSIAISFMILDTTVGSIYNAANETKRGFYTMLIMSCTMIASISIAIYLWNSIIAVAYAFLFARVVATLMNFYSLTHGLDGKFIDFLSCIFRPVIVGILLFVVLYLISIFMQVDNIFISFIIKVATGLAASLLLIQLISGHNLITLAKEKIKSLHSIKK